MAGLNIGLLKCITSLGLHDKVPDDDGVDQLHHYVTVTVLAFFGIVTSFFQFVAGPINCWNHGEYLSKHYQAHVNDFCGTQDLYYYPNKTDHSIMPFKLNVVGEAEDPTQQSNEFKLITFFRWGTSFFVVQALLFKIPNVMWGLFNAGSNIHVIVGMLQDMQFAKVKDKQEKLQQLALFLEEWLAIRRKPRWFLKATIMAPWVKKLFPCCARVVNRLVNSSLSSSYLLTKALFLFNNLLQFFLLSAFLQVNFWDLGFKLLQAHADDDKPNIDSLLFPTEALCHFRTYRNTLNPTIKGSSGRWVQCTVRINIFMEKFLLIEWLWFLLLQVFTIFNFVLWSFRLLRKKITEQFVQRYLRLSDEYNGYRAAPPSRSVEGFVADYLRSDGVLILRLLAVNTNDVIMVPLVGELERRYLECRGQQNKGSDSCSESVTLSAVAPEPRVTNNITNGTGHDAS